ncbi:ferrochelatase [Gallaecimonas sp. GXIMD4217]|uniref:ferrochelatase n=1 Tax=Gallaecimonas sp. GXIMD4217 TaxID=3131927 RepID=UPI00311B3BB6
MHYKGSPAFSHDQQPKLGVLLTNLGTPDAPDSKSLRRYLREFLWDPRITEMPRPLWWLVLNGVILNIRPRRSAEAYKTVWTERGSPLLAHSLDQAGGIETRLRERFGDHVEVALGMRYGNPSLAGAVDELLAKGVRRLLVLPLYPQYSATTTASTFDALAQDFQGRRWLPQLRFVSHYHDFDPYIEAMAARIRRHWQEKGRADRLIFSFHGIPERFFKKGDPYFCECHKSARLLAERLGLEEGQWQLCFQSRFGREPWLKPYLDETLKVLPGQGVKSVQVFSPGFAADCLETIEELGVENRDYFLAAGGQDYQFISCLNAEPEHLDALCQLIEQNLAGWTLPRGDEGGQTAALASKMGA